MTETYDTLWMIFQALKQGKKLTSKLLTNEGERNWLYLYYDRHFPFPECIRVKTKDASYPLYKWWDNLTDYTWYEYKEEKNLPRLDDFKQFIYIIPSNAKFIFDKEIIQCFRDGTKGCSECYFRNTDLCENILCTDCYFKKVGEIS